MSSDSTQQDVKRHYLRIKEGVDVNPALLLYCQASGYDNYSEANEDKTRLLGQYGLEDTSFIEVKFRR